MTKERPDSVELKPGSTFANRFKIVHKIGSGSSADVYLAKDTKLGKLKVAIKLIPADVKQDSRLVQRIARELQTVSYTHLTLPTSG